MKNKAFLLLTLAGLLALIIPVGGSAQDVPGFSLGAFYEFRTENEIGDDELSFNYYGARIAFRDERWVKIFVDVGAQEMDLDLVDDETAGAFGLGGIFWLVRQQYGYGALDLGLYGALYFADYGDVKKKERVGGRELKSDIKHYRYLAQMIARAEVVNGMEFFVRGGIQGSKLDADDENILKQNLNDDPDDDVVKLAINVGLDIELTPDLVATLEGNYSEAVGGAVRLNYWF